MNINIVLFLNLVIPLVTGLFFFLYFIYFIIANPLRSVSYRFFVVFLIGFSLFLIGRSLQVILGPHPIPLIIVNMRIFILCSVISPVVMLTANIFKRKRIRYKEIIIICICSLLGLIYVVFNTLGTKDSFILFNDNNIVLYDNFTPSMTPPFYAREVTLAVQVIIGIMLFAFSLYKLIKLMIDNEFNEFIRNKNFLINTGIFIFALSFIIGSLLKQWWIFYSTSIVSALFVGASVLTDIKEVHDYYEKLVPFIKDDIIHNFAFKDFSKIREMLRLLGKKTTMDTFVVIKITDNAGDLSNDLEKFDSIVKIINRNINDIFDDTNFIILPISNDRMGVILNLVKEPQNIKYKLIEVLEAVHDEITEKLKCNSKIGIGRSYGNIDDLRISYHEAMNAQEYAEQHEGSNIIHVENINEINSRVSNYPVKEKEKLLSSVKLGDIKESRNSLNEFILKFKNFIEDNPDILKVRLYELVGSLIDSAILGGGDEKKLNDLVIKYFNDINLIKDLNAVEIWLTTIVEEIAGNIGNVFDKRSKTLIENAKKYIEKNYMRQLSYKDVAKEIFISPSYFLNLFKKETDLTFVDYLTIVRINKAKELLKLTELNITEIAFEIGFNNSNYFSNIFKKITGISAKEYRKGK